MVSRKHTGARNIEDSRISKFGQAARGIRGQDLRGRVGGLQGAELQAGRARQSHIAPYRLAEGLVVSRKH